MAGILPQEEPCNKAYDEHETPGIHIGIPGVLHVHHRFCCRAPPAAKHPPYFCCAKVHFVLYFIVSDPAGDQLTDD